MDIKKQKRLKNQRKLKKIGISFLKEFGLIPFLLVMFFFSSILTGLCTYWFIATTEGLPEIIEMLNPFGTVMLYSFIGFIAIFIFWFMLIIMELTIKCIEYTYKDKVKKEIKNKR